MKENSQIGPYYPIGSLFLVLAVVFFGLVRSPQKAQEPDKKGELVQKFAKADAITDKIRDKASKFFRVQVSSVENRDKAAKFGTIVEDYSSFVIAATNKKSKPATSDLEKQALETTINLPNGKFEPLDVSPLNAAEAGIGKNYYIVQFGATATDEWLESLRDAGAEVVQYVAHQAFLVYADGETISKIADHSRVRWVGLYTAEQKISPQLNSFLSRVKGDRAMFDIAVFSRADLDEVRKRIANTIRGEVLTVMKLQHNFFNVVTVEVPLSDISEIAKIPDVAGIDPYEKPRLQDERAAQIMAGNFTNPTTLSPPGYDPLTQFGADGTDVTVSVVDDGVSIPVAGGFYITAANTVDGPLHGAAPGAGSGHGHLIASIIAGGMPFPQTRDPMGYNYGMGIAPKANIVNIPLMRPGYLGTDVQAYNDAVTTTGPNGVKGFISNNSRGAGLNNNAYDCLAARYDGFVRDASTAGTIDPICLVFAAGNSGPAALSLDRPNAAKNVISVANSENIRTIKTAVGDNLDDLKNTSSRGLTADGRIKPDITAPGTVITGSRAGNDTGVYGIVDGNHSWATGTSFAAPEISGAAALFTQYWKSGHGANPSPAMVKAAILITGQEMGGAETNAATIPNGIEGWGRFDMRLMLRTGVPMIHSDQETVFSDNGNDSLLNTKVAVETKPVRISLVWTDPPAAADPALVNNLDLTATIGGQTYKGNHFVGGLSAPGGNADTKNNVEQVFLAAGIPAGTPIHIVIKATALSGNGVLENTDKTDQHFALICYNCEEPFSPPVDLDTDGKTDIVIYRPYDIGEWWYLKSSNGNSGAFQFGSASDKPVAGDFTGDRKMDPAFFRPSTGEWFVLKSENQTYYSFRFGLPGDNPVVADFDGDRKADAAVFRPSEGTWYISKSGGGTLILPFGQAGDIPVVADYDGDKKADTAIFRPGTGEWWILNSSTNSVRIIRFGNSSDKPVQGDYTGDRKADISVWRPSTGEWFVLKSEDSNSYSFSYGLPGDVPAPGYYDDDERLDAAVFRPSEGNWYINKSTGGTQIISFGLPGDIPVSGLSVP